IYVRRAAVKRTAKLGYCQLVIARLVDHYVWYKGVAARLRHPTVYKPLVLFVHAQWCQQIRVGTCTNAVTALRYNPQRTFGVVRCLYITGNTAACWCGISYAVRPAMGYLYALPGHAVAPHISTCCRSACV